MTYPVAITEALLLQSFTVHAYEVNNKFICKFICLQ